MLPYPEPFVAMLGGGIVLAKLELQGVFGIDLGNKFANICYFLFGKGFANPVGQ